MLLKDTTGKPSTTQTMLILSFILMIVGAGLEMFGHVKTTSILPEIFYTCAAMYTGRRFKFGDKEIDESKTK